MKIEIVKNGKDIIFYANRDSQEPLLTIYGDCKSAVITDSVVQDSECASVLSECMSIVSIFLEALSASDRKMKDNFLDVIYINKITKEEKEAKYSFKKMLNWIDSGNIVTVNKKERTKYQFISFGYRNSKLIIMYKPVIW